MAVFSRPNGERWHARWKGGVEKIWPLTNRRKNPPRWRRRRRRLARAFHSGGQRGVASTSAGRFGVDAGSYDPDPVTSFGLLWLASRASVSRSNAFSEQASRYGAGFKFIFAYFVIFRPTPVAACLARVCRAYRGPSHAVFHVRKIGFSLKNIRFEIFNAMDQEKLLAMGPQKKIPSPGLLLLNAGRRRETNVNNVSIGVHKFMI